jgi:type II secretory pathway component PulF
MKCPKCGQEQPGNSECAYCGIIVEKYVARLQGQEQFQGERQSQGERQDQGQPPQQGQGRPHEQGRTAPGKTAAATPKKSSSGSFAKPSLASSLPPIASLWTTTREIIIPATAARRRFYASLCRMVRSGVSLEDGLQTLQLTGRGALREISSAALRGIRAGLPLAESLEAVPRLVPRAQRTILHAGEQTGHLTEVLEQLESMDADAMALARKLVSSLTYPIVVLLMSCIIMPVPTLVLGTVGDYVTEVAGRIGFLLAAMGLIWISIRLVSVAAPAIFGRAPGRLEQLLRPGRKSLFFLVLRTSLRSGVPIREALGIGALVWDSQQNRDLLDQAIATIDQGGTLTQALSPLLEQEWVVILATGEKSGTLEESFAELFEAYSQRAAARRKVLLIIATVLLTVAIFAYAASQVMGAYQQSVEAPMLELEQMMDREMRGIWNDL